jgi:hypothetical protein
MGIRLEAFQYPIVEIVGDPRAARRRTSVVIKFTAPLLASTP